MKRIPALTGLRFLFSAMIVISHFEFFGGEEAGKNFYDLYFHNPYMAVYFFFVVSGFGLYCKFCSTNTPALGQKKLSPWNCLKFAIGRVKKIYLLYLVTMILAMPMWISWDLQDGISLFRIFRKNTALLLLSMTLLQSVTGQIWCSHIYNSAAWFLSTIFCIYMCYPILELLNRRYFSRKPWLSLMLTLGCRLCLGEILEVVTRNTAFDTLSYVSPIIRIFDFTLGMLLCSIVKEKRVNEVKKDATVRELTAAALVLLWWVAREAVTLSSVLKNAVDLTLVLLVVYVFSLNRGRITDVLTTKLFQRLGNLSMYIYLIHYVIRMYAYPVMISIFGVSMAVKVATAIAIVMLTAIAVKIVATIDNKVSVHT